MNITVDNFFDIFDDINNRIWGIPFGNSNFQNENFIINNAGTPERAYRAAALRLQDRLNSLKEAKFQSLKNDIKKRQLKYKIEKADDIFEKELLEVELLELLSNEPYTSKLINDAIVEANQLYSYIQSQPKYTREQFENGERKYFEKKLIEEVTGTIGALKSLSDMGIDIEKLKKGELQYKEQEDALQLR